MKLSKSDALIRKKELTKARDKMLHKNNELEQLEEGTMVLNQSDTDILKELFTLENIKTKTELSSEQIRVMAQLYVMADMIHFPEIKQLCDEFATLQVSHKRGGRKEFVDGLKGFDLNEKQRSGLLGGMFRSG